MFSASFPTCIVSLLLAFDGDARVFETTALPAPAEVRLHQAQAGALRVLTVEERVGKTRREELVRVPVFFHEGECNDLDGLSIVEVGENSSALPFQADDIRRDASGKITRAHLYFEVNLEPWQRRQFHLVSKRAPARPLPSMPIRVQGHQATLVGENLSVTFHIRGPRAGSIAGLETKWGKVHLAEGVLGPRLSLVRQNEDLKVIRTTPISYLQPESQEVRSVGYASGPLFAKVVVVTGPPKTPDRGEFTYLLPRKGSYLVQTERLFPAEKDAVQTVGAAADHVLLGGKLVLGTPGKQQVVAVPAGLRKLTRSVHGHVNRALVNKADRISLFPIPYVQTGVSDLRLTEDGTVEVFGAKHFRREGGSNSHTLKSFWGEVRYVFSDAVEEETLWNVSCRHFQPLVAIVDEPGLGTEQIHEAMPAIAQRFFDIKNWGRGWAQTSAMHYLARNEAAFQKTLAKVPSDKEIQTAYYLPGWALRGESAPPPGPKKDVGRIDPYHISYAFGSVVPLALYLAPSERMDGVARAVAQFSRQVNGKKEQFGFPYIDCFATALNMQIGSYMMGIYAGNKTRDLDLAGFYRDCARTPSIQGIYGHGQRPYPGNIHGPGPSDLLYESTSDFQFRILELYCQENLELHPMVFGRYFDCVDVNADLCHRPTEKRASWHRANFWRSQAHDHRWEAWDCAPYMGIFARPADRGWIGTAEANYFLRKVAEHHINWSELLWFFHADVLLKHSLPRYQPAPLPPAPANLAVVRGESGNTLTWKAVPDAVGYRVYRAEQMGGPWTYLNSPYTARPGNLVKGTQFMDSGGTRSHVYWVTAEDAHRRESAWFPEEGQPPGK